jgi:transposase
MRTPIGILREGAVAELTAAVRAARKASQERRLRALLAVARGEHVPRVAKVLGVAERAVRNWVHRYNRSGLTGLQDRRGGRKCRLSAEELARVRARLLAEPRPEDGVCSLRGEDMRRIVKQEFGAAYARSSIYYFLHRTLGLSYVTPRPLHAKTDLAAQEAFKKTSRRRWSKSGNSTRTGGSKSGSRTKRVSDNRAR